VRNPGSLPLADMEVKAILPKELELVPGGAKGPVPATAVGGVVTFGKATVAPGQALEYTLEARALKAGDLRFRAEVRSPSLEQLLFEEEATQIVAPGQNSGAAAPAGGGSPVSIRGIPSPLPPGPPR
jgi:hypothetical protein